MGTNRIIIRRRRRAPSGKPSTKSTAEQKAPAVTTETTDLGIQVNVDSNDAVIRELALQRTQKEKELEQETKLRASRREAATKAAELQRRAQAIQIEQRQFDVGREIAKINRESRTVRSNILSRAAASDVTNTSAFKAARIATRSAETRETGAVRETESRNQLLDQIRREEIDANLSARIAENQDPVNVFLGEEPATNAYGERSGASADGGTFTIRSRLKRKAPVVKEETDPYASINTSSSGSAYTYANYNSSADNP